MKVAYIVSRFPKLTETFVLYELLALRRQGVPVSLYPLLRTRQRVVHPEVESLGGCLHRHGFVSVPVVAANWRFLRRRPQAYLEVLAEVLHGTWGSANFFLGAMGIFPKAVRFAQEMVEEGVTHVHAHFANHPAVAALIVHRLTGIPFSFTAHGHDIHVERRMLKEKIDAARFAVMISEYNRNLVLDDCRGVDAGKVHVIHCGADTERFAPPTSRERDGPFSIACVGSFIEVKGHRHLVEACRLLKDRGRPLHCHLIGDGPLRRRIEDEVAAAGLADAFVLHGPLARPDVARLMARCDAIVQPSVPTRRGSREGIPVSLMEGMATGLPVVASQISGIPELVEDGRNGFLTPPGDATVLAGAIERLMVDPGLCRRLGAAGREKVLLEFDLFRNAARLVQLIRRSASAAGPSRPAGRAQGAGR